jgi:hypothetical protein
MSRKLAIRLWAIAIVALTAATCGVVLAVAQSSHPQPLSTTQTLSPKQQFIANEQKQLAEAQAGPRAPKPPPSEVKVAPPTPCVPAVSLPFPDNRIHVANQGGPFGSSANFQAVSSWVGSVAAGSATYAVWSGADGSVSGAPGVAGVDVYTEQVAAGGCGVTFTPVGVFTESTAAGLLTITQIRGDWLQLSASGGSTIYFDLVTHRFAVALPMVR